MCGLRCCEAVRAEAAGGDLGDEAGGGVIGAGHALGIQVQVVRNNQDLRYFDISIIIEV